MKKSTKNKVDSAQKKRTRERISIFLDADILDFFRERANHPNAPAYQRQINNELRQIVEANKQARKSGLSLVESSILENELFIRILKEKMEGIQDYESK